MYCFSFCHLLFFFFVLTLRTKYMCLCCCCNFLVFSSTKYYNLRLCCILFHLFLLSPPHNCICFYMHVRLCCSVHMLQIISFKQSHKFLYASHRKMLLFFGCLLVCLSKGAFGACFSLKLLVHVYIFYTCTCECKLPISKAKEIGKILTLHVIVGFGKLFICCCFAFCGILLFGFVLFY